jgi:hypothetical protein
MPGALSILNFPFSILHSFKCPALTVKPIPHYGPSGYEDLTTFGL